MPPLLWRHRSHLRVAVARRVMVVAQLRCRLCCSAAAVALELQRGSVTSSVRLHYLRCTWFSEHQTPPTVGSHHHRRCRRSLFDTAPLLQTSSLLRASIAAKSSPSLSRLKQAAVVLAAVHLNIGDAPRLVLLLNTAVDADSSHRAEPPSFQ